MKKEFTQDQINFFKNLNSLLMLKEREVFEKCKTLYETYENRLIKNGGDINDYEIDIEGKFLLLGDCRKCFCITTLHQDVLDYEVFY